MNKSMLKISFAIVAFTFSLFSSPAFAAQAPDFKLEGQKQAGQKQAIQLSDYKGKIVYLDFWASWCQPCRKSFGWMNKMQERYGDEGLEIIAINLDDSKDKAKKFLKKLPAKFNVAFDPKGRTAASYKIKAMPSSFIIDAHGKVVHANLGFHGNDEDKLEAKIRKMIRQSAIASR